MNKTISTGLMLAFSNALMTTSAYAGDAINGGSRDVKFVTLTNDPAGSKDLLGWVNELLNYAVGLTALIAVAILIFAGYTYITANGDEAKVKKATQAIVYAIVGMVIAFAANMIIRFVVGNVLK